MRRRVEAEGTLIYCRVIVCPQGSRFWHQGRGSGPGTGQKGHLPTAVDDRTELFPRRAQVPCPRRRASLGEDKGDQQRSVVCRILLMNVDIQIGTLLGRQNVLSRKHHDTSCDANYHLLSDRMD